MYNKIFVTTKIKFFVINVLRQKMEEDFEKLLKSTEINTLRTKDINVDDIDKFIAKLKIEINRAKDAIERIYDQNEGHYWLDYYDELIDHQEDIKNQCEVRINELKVLKCDILRFIYIKG